MIPRLPNDIPVMEPVDYTVSQLEADIVEIILDGNLDTINPVPDEYEDWTPSSKHFGGTCVYEGPDGRRCLFGEWFHRRGHGTKGLDDVVQSVTGVMLDLGYPDEVARRAGRLQGFVDGGSSDGKGRKPWRSLLGISDPR